MSDSTPFYVDRGKTGRAVCKGCKALCLSGELRLAKVVPSPYGDNQSMKSWFHVDCFIAALLKQRPTTKRVDSIYDIGNWDNLSSQDKNFLLGKFNECEQLYAEKHAGKYTAKRLTDANEVKHNVSLSSITSNRGDVGAMKENEKGSQSPTSDNQFSYFEKLCRKIAKVDAYTDKTAIVNNFFRKGTDGISFKGDIILWCKLLLPQVSKRVYNLKSKQLVKLFSKIFNTDHDEMLTHLEKGDIADTIQVYFSVSKTFQPSTESLLTIYEVDDFLNELSKLTREEEQIYQFKKIVKKCTLDDLRMVIRLIKGDLRMNAGPKHILEGVHPDAYAAFQTSRDLDMVLHRVLFQNTGKHLNASQQTVAPRISLMTPVLPMLAEACKSVEMAMRKCPNGMFSEIKYDGERVQVHKQGNEFKYFSRALKPVMPHKVSHFKEHLPKAFPKGVDMILDAEVLMVDVKTGKPLPFGTLGIHKQTEFKDAEVCLFVFDCLYYNGEVLLEKPIRERRRILHEHMQEVKNHVMFSEQQLIKQQSDLAKMIAEVLQLGLEGLVLKDLESTYEPGKRHWLKVKKDYLFDGAMADTADLVVLGAWFGTGKKGGMMSVFLMGCLDTKRNVWVTVTKVHTGHDDATLQNLQKELGPLMLKISQDHTKIPSWLDCKKGMVPDFVASNPKKQPVWEITGTELTKANLHTADGISIRFPRVTRIRKDKNWETATNLDELKNLYITSKQQTDVSLLNSIAQQKNSSGDNYEPPKKRTKSTSKSLQSVGAMKATGTRKSPSKSIPCIEKYSSRKSPAKSIASIDKFVTKKSPLKVTIGSDRSITKNKLNKQKNTESDKETISDTSLNSSFDKKKTRHKLKFVPENPLPIVFKNLRLGFYPDFLSFPAEERHIFERHWIAYGGIIVKNVKAVDVDYMLHNNDVISFQKTQKLKRKLPSNVKHVHKSWLIECINNLALCDTAKHAVFIEP